MAKLAVRVLVAAAVLALLGGGSYAIAGGGKKSLKEDLESYQEVPAVSSTATGTFEARIANDDQSFDYTIEWAGLTGTVTQSHIHFGQRSVNGGISVFFCSNLGNGPPGTQLCPTTPSGSVSGTAKPADVIGPTGQGIAAGEFAELLRAIRAGKTYANVHSTTFGGGEIRAQLNDRGGDSGGSGDSDD